MAGATNQKCKCDCFCYATSSPENALPKYFVNADSLITAGLPDLNQGEFKRETTSLPSVYARYFHGGLAEWGDHFQNAVIAFYKDPAIKKAFDRCSKVPICMDRTIETLNKNAMTTEHILAGAEITLSGRFFQNALAPVIAITKTLADEEYGHLSDVGDFPKDPTFGDSWIIDIVDRASNQEPDVVLKLRCRKEDAIRLVGELKFNKTVSVKAAIEEYEKNRKLSGLLGQIVSYMASHRLRHGFISTYDETVFLHFDTDIKNGVLTPLIKFSNIVLHSDILDIDSSKISVRLGLLWLLHESCSSTEDNWRISEELFKRVTDLGWIQKDPASAQQFMTPFGKGDPNSLLHSLNDMTLSDPDISVVSALSCLGIDTTPYSVPTTRSPSNTRSYHNLNAEIEELSPSVSRFKLGSSSQRASIVGQQFGLKERPSASSEHTIDSNNRPIFTRVPRSTRYHGPYAQNRGGTESEELDEDSEEYPELLELSFDGNSE